MVTRAGTTSTYQYNGLGDRVRETNNGVTTNFTLDLNTGLTQVLSDGTNTYLHGSSSLAPRIPLTSWVMGREARTSWAMGKNYLPFVDLISTTRKIVV